MTDASDRCQIRGCRTRGVLEQLVCAKEGCGKKCHIMCYQGLVIKVANGPDLTPLAAGKVACTKGCYKEYMKAVNGTGDSSRGKWTSDGIKGPDDAHTSMKILIDWMTTEGNYSKYRGKDNNGVTKMQFATILAERMRNETLSTERNAKQVMDKISRVEESFRTAHEFATSQTGAGIQENEGEQTFKDLVRRKCSYYYDLIEVMMDRASTAPRATNFDPSFLDNDDDSEAEEPLGQLSQGSQTQPMSQLTQTQNEGMLPATTNSPQVTDTEVIENISTVGAPSAANSVASSRKNSDGKQNNKKRSSSSSSGVLMDDKTVEMLQEASKVSRQKVVELNRHNKRLEDVEERKLALQLKQDEREQKRFETQQWKGRSDELDYKVKLVREYNSLKTQGLTNEQIIALFPEMASVINTLEMN
jgi:hypothetical protein